MNYENISVKLRVFSVVLCVNLISYTELHRGGTEFHRVFIRL